MVKIDVRQVVLNCLFSLGRSAKQQVRSISTTHFDFIICNCIVEYDLVRIS
jgi:hypothetical protein